MPALVFESRREWLEKQHGLELKSVPGEEIIFRVDALEHTVESMGFVVGSILENLNNRCLSGDFRNPTSPSAEGQARYIIGYRLSDFDREFGEFVKEHPAKIIERIRRLLLSVETLEPYEDTEVWADMGDTSLRCMNIEKE
ncbi:uncharacterized protein KD926_009431 [Aspergillus affinis]|uniref:uncharacterized protein n=1 Tax=Aspergillus affinis TaxID=1070780 RepID=UPI0022FE00D3|nr:uncharacterized protein KD926_009431 [Aspergillus affinis]KAI9039417.1 hypothetical protein KD926_009431 [Aspergillus affinis]